MVQPLEKLVLGAVTLFSLSGCNEQSYDTGFPQVVISPQNPRAGDALSCWVEDGAGMVYDFVWFVNRDYVFEGHGALSTLPGGHVEHGDYVECSAWTAMSSTHDTYEIGFQGVYVE